VLVPAPPMHWSLLAPPSRASLLIGTEPPQASRGAGERGPEGVDLHRREGEVLEGRPCPSPGGQGGAKRSKLGSNVGADPRSRRSVPSIGGGGYRRGKVEAFGLSSPRTPCAGPRAAGQG
jgi:hypothetical protein